MGCYLVYKRVWSDKAKAMPRYQPYTWVNLPSPFGKMENFPTSRVAFRALVQRLVNKFGPGRYFVLRAQFEREAPGWKPVVYLLARRDFKYRLVKRYTQYKSHEGKVQGYWKEHRKRLHITTDVRQELRRRRYNMLRRMRHEVKTVQPFVHEIRTSTGLWVYRTKR